MERKGTNHETGLEIAVIGMACRFPGAKNIAEFWANLKNGVESVSCLSEEEIAEISPELRNNPDFVKTKGGELEDSEYFDAPFFNYTPLEAEHMQPQIRIFHECLWTALEDAGCNPDSSSRLIGVYASLPTADDWEMLSKASLDVEQSILAANFLNNRDFLSTIVSYKLNLTGPSFVMNTACSTSLVVIHLACQGLLGGDCDMALASGVSINYQGIKGYLYQEGGINSPDGHCRAFDASANGTRGGDGAGVVVLKRLEDAVGDGDHFYAVIKGSAINNDGNRKVGFTAPSIDGQAYVIRKALKMAEIDRETVRFIEAHGTATPLGDVTEVEALKIAFNTDKKRFCSLGSVKTNIGHLGEAAGIAGFIKTVLALKNRQIPPSLLYKNPNPEIDFENSPFYVNTTLIDLKDERSPFRAGVSSFGIGGTNAHVVLEEWPGAAEPVGQWVSGSVRMPSEGTRGLAPLSNRQYQLILLSAKTQTALDKMTENLGRYLDENPGVNLANVAYTLQTGRKNFPYRRKWVSASIHEAIKKLSSSDTRNIQSYHLTSGDRSKNVIFMFPGLGSQYVNMGLDLYRTEPVFREEMDRCFEILKSLMDDDIKAILYPQNLVSEVSWESEETGVNEETGTTKNRSHRSHTSYKSKKSYIQRTEIAQVVIFILEYVLAKLLMAWGIRPHAMIGYSFGEYTAASISGVFSLADILRLLVARGKLVSQLPHGMMLSVPLPVKEVKPHLKDQLTIAIDNGSSCVVSGSAAAIKEFEKEIKKKKIICMPLDAAHAIHSPMMDPILEKFTAEAAKISLNPPQIPYISTVTGNWIKVEDAVSPEYWARQLRETVCFARGIQNLRRESDTIFLELGPGREIGALVEREINENRENSDRENRDKPGLKSPVIHLLRQPKKAVPDDYYLLDKIGLLWLYGVKIDWQAYYANEKRHRLPLPTYPFDKHRYWRLPEQRKTGTAVKQELNRSRELTDCFWVPSWKQTVLPLILSPGTPGEKTNNHCRLVFLDKNEKIYRGRFAVNLVNRLKQKGCQVITAAQGETFSHENDGEDHHYIINPNEKEDYEALIRDIYSRGMEKFPDMIIHLWTLSTGEAAPGGKNYFQQQQVEGYYSLLYLAQALIKNGIGRSMPEIDEDSLFLRIEIVTDHLHAVSSEDEIDAEKAPITGLCKTIPQEYPNITCRSLDIKVPVEGTPGETRLIDRIMIEFTNPVRDLTVAYRGNTRWVKFYEPFHLEPRSGDPALLRRNGVYLITGGLGNDSFIRARYLAENFLARLVLTGRTPLPEREYWSQYLMINGDQDPVSIKIKRIQELETLGAEVLAISADISDELEMRLVMQQAEQSFGPINGVIHAAGITGIDSSRLVMELGREESEWHFQPKVYGVYVLEKILEGKDLDFCLLTSSIASIIGGIGLSAYTAASIFMDVIVQRKNNRASSVPWIGLNWVGSGPEETVEVFKRVLSVDGVGQVVFSQADLHQLIRERIELKSVGVKREGEEAHPVYERPALSTPYQAPRNASEQKLAEIWQRFFGIDKIGVTDDIFDLGGDSLKAVNILAIVQKELNISIPLKEFFDNPTIEGAAKYIEYAEPAERIEKGAYVSIPSAEKKEYYALSSAQRRMFLLQQMNPGSTAYNSPMVNVLKGYLDIEKLEQTLKTLIDRHESLRTSIINVGEESVQKVHERIKFEIEYYDLTTDDTEGVAPSCGQVLDHGGGGVSLTQTRDTNTIIKDFTRPFDLLKAPLLRVGLIKITGNRHLLVEDMHHVITDAVSLDLFSQEFNALYEGGMLPPLRLQYKEYSQWQNSKKQRQIVAAQEAYWLRQFQGEIPVIDLPYDYVRPKVRSFSGKMLTFDIGKEETRALNRKSSAQGATLYMTLLGITSIFLARLSGRETVVVGTPIANRTHAEMDLIIGMFVNTLVLKSEPTGEKTVREFLNEVKQTALNAFANQDYQYEELVEHLAIARSNVRNPLFDTLFALQNFETRAISAPGLDLQPYPYDRGIVKFDLCFQCFDRDDTLAFILEYPTELFRHETAARFAGYFKKILSSVMEKPGEKISAIEIISEEEREQLIYRFNNTVIEIPGEKTLHGLFAEQVERTPDSIALVGTSGIKYRTDMTHMTYISYSQLNEKSNQLAGLLIEKGVKPDNIVGLLVEPSLAMIIGIMAILKSGGAYLPIDPQNPQKRIDYMLKDSSVKILLTDPGLSGKFKKLSIVNCQLLMVNEELPGGRRLNTPPKETNSINNYQLTINNSQLKINSLAYAIYTSGTTGKSKGTLLENRNLANYVGWFSKKARLTTDDRAILTSSFGFDLVYTAIYPSILTGSRLHVVRKETYLSPGELLAYICRHRITYIKITPTLFSTLVENPGFSNQSLSSLRLIVLGGETIRLKDVEKAHDLCKHLQIMNHYGPTETTIGSTAQFIDFSEFHHYKERPAIGQPIDNTKIFILDKGFNLLPVGVPGELCISGQGVGRGYINRPELTAEKFCLWRPGGALFEKTAPVKHLDSPRKNFSLDFLGIGKKDYRSYKSHMSYKSYKPYIYRTGDLARWLSDGNIEFLGRVDQQVKIRGYRIELGEIENRLLKYKEIKNAVVLALETPEEKYLCAYIVSARENGIPGIRETLAKELPEYMMPSYFVEVEKIPLTPNGKIDTAALPKPWQQAGESSTAPRNDLEKKLVEVWAKVLGNDAEHATQLQKSIGINDNFFQLGGHSIKANRLTFRIYKELKVKIPLAVLFETPTIRGLSKYIGGTVQDTYDFIMPVEKKEYYVLSSSQERMYILQQLDINSIAYNMPDFIPLPGELDMIELKELVEKLIKRHESLRTSFHMIGDQPVQQVHDRVEFEIENYQDKEEVEAEAEPLQSKVFADVSRRPGGQFFQKAPPWPPEAIIKNFIRPFDLSQAPILRMGLIKLLHTPSALHGHPSQEGREHKYILLVDMHHIISDGVSRRVLREDFVALCEGKGLGSLRIGYKDFAQWQNSPKQVERLQQQMLYWKKEYAGEIPVLELPTDNPRPLVQGFEGDILGFQIDRRQTDGIIQVAKKEGATPFMVISSIYAILLAKLSGQEDIVIGIDIEGRQHAEIQGIIGMFVNALALRCFPAPGKTIKEFLAEVKDRSLKAFENQDYPFDQLVGQVSAARDTSRNPIFDVMFSYRDRETTTRGSRPGNLENLEETSLELDPYTFEWKTSKFDLTLNAIKIDEDLEFSFEYSTKLFREQTIRRYINYFKQILSSVIADKNLVVSQIQVIPGREKRQLLFEFNDTKRRLIRDKCYPRLYEEQAARTPDKIAAVNHHWEITYNRLDQAANRIAAVLAGQGITVNRPVAIHLKRSIAMLAAIIGVFKAGAAYVPIDVTYPKNRTRQILEDSGDQVVITEDDNFDWQGRNILNPDPGQMTGTPEPGFPVSAPQVITQPYDLAYIIYTSGSTGKPKGVMIHRLGMINHLYAKINDLGIDSEEIIAQTASACFDISVWQFLAGIIKGGITCIIDEEVVLGGRRFLRELQRHRVTILETVPSLMNVFLEVAARETDKRLDRLRWMILTGEPLTASLAREWYRHYPGIKLVNAYGPTEASDDVTHYILTGTPPAEQTTVPIGKPIQNTHIYILDRNLSLCPIGVRGEICVAGIGVGKGYWKDIEKTEKAFIPNPYREEINDPDYAWLYKTGDIGYYRENGHIECLGRIDHQVKIRGNRVELGEIENQILNYRTVKNAVVIDKEDKQGSKYLCAYIAGGEQTDIPGLKEYLAKQLPGYMVPAFFVELAELPLTPNGKIDRKALPEPREIGMPGETGYIPPVSDKEKKLTAAWEQVLGREKIGIEDNFFMIGGDSIKAIQIMSRMSSAGYKLEMRDLFQYPVISQLVNHIKTLERIPDQVAITGTIPLTPIQQAFFKESYRDPHHYNQAVMLYSKEGFDKEAVKQVFTRVQQHHDALRMTYERDEHSGKVVQVAHGPDYPLSLQEYDIRNHENCTRELERKINQIQASIDLEKGPLMKLGLFYLKDGDRLLIVIHHLVIDGVSWRILFEDIETLYNQYKQGGTWELPRKTDSYKHWAEKLQEYANSQAFFKEKTYWQKLEQIEVPPIPKEIPGKDNYVRDTGSESFTLNEEETKSLMTGVNEIYRTEINDILLTALAVGIKKTFGQDRVLIALEGHGREAILEEMDVDRTVGWFTSLYPVLMDISCSDDPGRQIKEIKETLRRIPNKGIGYGILKYLTYEENKKDIQFKLEPQIGFNYLGQFDAGEKQLSAFEVAKESTGNSLGPNNKREYILDVSGVTANNRLTMIIFFNKTHFKPGTMKTLIRNFQTELTSIIAYCSPRENIEPTPGDFTYKSLSIENIDRLMKEYPGIEDIYTLTPMQEGMLYHALADNSSYTYFEQISYRLRGELDINLVEKSLNELFKRHDILRTAFVYKETGRPVQLVLKDREIDFYYEDIGKIRDREEMGNFIKEFKEKDKQRYFDISQDVLMRVTVFREEEAAYEFIWSFHHILMDGWCTGILNAEFLEIYYSYLENRPYRLPVVKPYRKYIQWLQQQEQEEAARYWENYLESYEEPAGVPGKRLIKEENRERNERISIELDREKTAGINRLAAREQVTLNTVTQAIWGILLGKYNGREDVVFGAVVSGRPAGLAGVESIVGLFINTIPVRIRFEEKMKFNRLIQKVQAGALAGEPHHYHPLAEIQARTALKQNLIDHIFIFENYPIAEQIEGYGNRINKPGLKITEVEVYEQTNYDFNVVLAGTDRIGIIFQYDGNVYERDIVECIARHFIRTVEQVIQNREMEFGEITLLSKEEKNRVLYEFNETAAPYPAGKTIHGLFEEQAEQTPERIALVGSSGIKYMTHLTYMTYISYRQLHEKSNRLAGLLIQKGIQTDNIVGIMVERSVEMIIGILAILKAGGAYLPIDSDYPRDRIDYMLKDSGAKILLTGQEIAGLYSPQAFNNRPKGDSSHQHLPPAPATSLAYVIYTSGTTGKPKGVMSEHGGIFNTIYWRKQQYKMKPGERALQLFSYVFDGFLTSFFTPVVSGVMVVQLRSEEVKEISRVKETIVMMGITHFICVPSLYRSLMEISTGKELSSLKALTLGGEQVHPGIIEKSKHMHPLLEICNEYGPTESSVNVSYYGNMHPGTAIFIGRPIANVKIYIIDKNINLVPIGITGEIAIAGKGLARGYMNQPGLTAEKFCLRQPGGSFRENRPMDPHKSFSLDGTGGLAPLPDRKVPGKNYLQLYNHATMPSLHHPNTPITHSPHLLHTPYSPIYKTGDLARMHPDGNIEFIGRQDDQVKIRGYRVELGEIENRILSYPGIKGAVVWVHGEEGGEKYICVYIVTAAEKEAARLREFLLKALPGYMIPAYIEWVEKIPLTPGGKVDRNALPKPGIKTRQKYTAPMNEIEKKLVKIWSEVLGRDEIHAAQLQSSIRVHDDFFQLGGHSLKATNLAAKIHRELEVKVPVAEIFKTPTIREMAENIKGKHKDLYISIEPVEEKEYYELSPAQKRLYILQQLVTENTGYNMPAVITLGEKVEKEELESVFKRLIARHESLRTSLITVKDRPVQRIHRRVGFTIGINEATGEEELETVISGLTRPFNLQRAPLLRVNLLEVKGAGRLLFIDMHHIITDGTSQGILEREFRTLQEGRELRPQRLRYKDYSQWDNSTPRQEALKQQESYWQENFSGEIPMLEIPTDNPRPAMQGIEGKVVAFSLNPGETAAVKRNAAENQTTLYMFLLAVMNVLLSKLSGQEDIIIGTPIAARRHADMQEVIGMLVNTLAMRNYPTGDKPFREFLKEVKRRTLDSYENQEYPFELLVEKIAVHRDTGRNPIFDVMFNMLNQAEYKGQVPGPDEQDNYQHKEATSKFDLNLTAMEMGDRLFYTLEYSTRLFKPGTIEKLIGYYKNILKVLSRDTGIKISGIEILSNEDREALLSSSIGIENDNDEIITVHRWYEEQAARTPDHIALHGCMIAWMHGEDGSLTYKELNEKSHRLASYIKEKGAGPDSVIGLMAERSVEMITGILAIMKTGGAYLPIDTEYPAERKRYMIREAGIRWLSVSGEIEDIGDEIFHRREVIDLRREEIYIRGNHKLEYTGGGTGLAYVIYTSGSTGKPKGVMVEHRNLTNLMKYQFRHTNIDCTRVLQFSTISFDASFHEIFSALLSGGRLYLVNKETRTEIPALFRLIEKNGIKTVFLPISFLKVIFKEDEYIRLIPRSIRHIQTAGEQVVISDNFRKYLRENQVYLHNHYGPSETHVVTTLTLYPGEEIPEIPSIGKPVMKTAIYIVDKWEQLSPPGVPGEILIGGVQVGRGYLNRPELTAEKFLPVFNMSYKSHMSYFYQTGDLAKWLPDENIQFLGRIDYQVKIRGFRVEIGEIENQLMNHPGIKETVVMMRWDETGEKYLCAYIVTEQELEISQIREYLQERLPDYMIPAFFVHLEQVPLTPNRKINRAVLPAPGIKTAKDYVAPGNRLEEKMVELWSEVLGAEKEIISIDRNFFEIGGHSLKATVLISKIHRAFDVKMPLAEVFKTPTIKALAQYIRESVKDRYTSIQSVEKKEYYPFSPAQKRLYFLQQMNLDSTAYNMPEIIPLSVEFDLGKIEETFKKLIKRHESLRTSFDMVNDTPVQVVHDEVEFEIEYKKVEEEEQTTDDRGQTTDDRGQTIGNRSGTHLLSVICHLSSEFIYPFDLSRAPLLRVGVLETGTGRNYHYLMVDMHHIISDGVSHQVLVEDFMALHEGEELFPLRVQYKDFSEWQNSEKEKEKLKQQEAYWLKEFSGEIPVLNIPTDYPRAIIQSFEGNTVSFETGRIETQLLKKNAQENGVTLFMLLLAITDIWLAKISNQQDIVIGTPIAGRRHADLLKVIGMFVNTLVLRSSPGIEKTFTGFLKEVRDNTLEAFNNQDYQFEELVGKVVLNRAADRNPLFDVMFELQNAQGASLLGEGIIGPESADLDMKTPAYENRTSKFDLFLFTSEVGNRLHFTFQYCTKLFKKETILRFIAYFKKIVSIIVSEPNVKLGQIDIMSEDEKQRILYDFNDTISGYPKDKTIHGLVEEQAERAGGRIAVIGLAGTGNQQVTHWELNERANIMACFLKEKGVSPDTIVGMMMERSVEMIIGILGILKAGGAYLPIDPDYPEERIKYMLKDSKIKILVKNSIDFSILGQGKVKKERLEEIEIFNCQRDIPCSAQSNSPLERGASSTSFKKFGGGGVCLNLQPEANPSNLAYLIYTSGTTGKPKGVLIENQNVLRLLFNDRFQFDFDAGDVWTLFHSFCFDLSVWEMYGALLYGGKLVIIPKETARYPAGFLEILKDNHVTVLNQTPSAFYPLIDEELKSPGKNLSIKYVIFGGEALKPTKLSEWYAKYPGTKLINMFGITETTVHVTFKEVGQGDIEAGISNIGKPIPTLTTYIMDKHMTLLPVGVPGECWVGGDAVGRGYLNRPQLTKEKFVPNPYQPGERLYRSGDLIRWLENGEMEYLGRIDHQVKIRGYRIELGEIESRLLRHDKIKEAVVTAEKEKTGTGDRFLSAYIVPEDKDITFAASELREYLLKELPEYMVPSCFFQLDFLPLTPNGKVDRKALDLHGTRLTLGTTYAAPQNDIEKKIVNVWKEILQTDKIGIHDNYFELGGNSLDIIRINKRLKEIFQMDISIVTMFRYTTVYSFANYLIHEAKEILDREAALKRGKKGKIQRLRKRKGTRNG